MIRKLSALLISAVFAVALCACTGGPVDPAPEESTLTFAQGRNEALINWYGRCYHDAEKEQVSFSNSSSGFEVTFNGTQLKARLISTGSQFPQEAQGSAYVYVFVDGASHYSQAELMELNPDGQEHEVVLAEGLERGTHTVKVLKCTEVKYGTAYLTALTADGDFLTPPARPALKVELLGDSILSGSEVMRESTTGDSLLTVSENSLAAYGYVAAEVLDAEVSAITRSGALVSGYNGYTSIPDIYDQYSAADPAEWDFGEFVPDIVILDLGTNDVLIGAPTALIRQKYGDFLLYIRSKYPEAAIFCCYGAMITTLNTLIPEIVEELKDQNIYTCALPALTAGGHPRVQQHETNGYHLGGLIVRTLGLLGENE